MLGVCLREDVTLTLTVVSFVLLQVSSCNVITFRVADTICKEAYRAFRRRQT